ncbi:MAG TPA: TetR/AcrR family transcriptional regulator [Actinomycetota bacterium]|nr:TetR/AcrR family transcriptional regulator [Actinomycetota bacterium]
MTRLKLLEVAEEVFGEKGYDLASISEITRRAGVAQGTFYLYFEGKRQIFSELVRSIGRTLRHELQTAIVGATTRAEVERLGYQAFFDYVRRHPSIYRIVRQAEFVDRKAFSDYYRTFAEGYQKGLEASAASGQVRDLDPEVVAWCLMGMGDLVGVRWILLDGGGRVPKKVLDTMLDLIANGLNGAGNAK